MIAAGSVVAAVQGLHLGNTNTFLCYQRLTHFLSQVIRCDPVSESADPKLSFLLCYNYQTICVPQYGNSCPKESQELFCVVTLVLS